jgi:hypothetical protein
LGQTQSFCVSSFLHVDLFAQVCGFPGLLPISHQMKSYVFCASSFVWHTQNHYFLRLERQQILWG